MILDEPVSNQSSPLDVSVEYLLPAGESNEDYHKRHELSSSDIKHAKDGGAAFKRMVLEKDLLPKKNKDYFDLGTCGHALNLQGDDKQFVIMPNFRPQPKLTMKAQVEEFEACNLGKIILTEEQGVRLYRMHKVFKNSREATDFVNNDNAIIEQGYTYKDPATGILCKFRPDIIIPQAGLIVDYKTTGSGIKDYECIQHVIRYAYHLSAAHYLEGAKRHYTSVYKWNYIFIFQQSVEPFGINIVSLDEMSLRKSFAMRGELMKRIHEWSEENKYPQLAQGKLKSIQLPGYAFEV